MGKRGEKHPGGAKAGATARREKGEEKFGVTVRYNTSRSFLLDPRRRGRPAAAGHTPYSMIANTNERRNGTFHVSKQTRASPPRRTVQVPGTVIYCRGDLITSEHHQCTIQNFAKKMKTIPDGYLFDTVTYSSV